MKNNIKNDENVVSYKMKSGRGRPAIGKIVRTKVVCVEIENLNNQRHVFIPVSDVKPMDKAVNTG